MNFIINNKISKKSDLFPYIFLFIISVLMVGVFFTKPTDSSWLHYLLFLLTFSVTAIITFSSLIEFISSKYVCFLFSLTYSFMSYHFLQYNHVFLCFYGLLPYAITYLLKFTLDLCVLNLKNILGLLIVDIFLIVVQPKWGIVIFIISVVFALYRIINQKKIGKWYILVMLLTAFSFITNGLTPEPYTGIKLAELFIPLENGYINGFSKIYSYFDKHLVQYEIFHIKLQNYSHLGIVLSLSLIHSLFKFFFLKEDDDVVNFCNIMVVGLLFVFLFRGITAIIYCGYKAFANFEIFIMIIAFLLCITGGKALEKMKGSSNKLLFYGFSGIIFFISILGCIPKNL